MAAHLAVYLWVLLYHLLSNFSNVGHLVCICFSENDRQHFKEHIGPESLPALELSIWGSSQPQCWLVSIQYSPGAQSFPCICMLVSGCNFTKLVPSPPD